MKKLLVGIMTVAFVLSAGSVYAVAPSLADDFNDNTRNTGLWGTYAGGNTGNPTSITETNQRLEFTTPGGWTDGSISSHGFLSNPGFVLNGSDDFSTSTDFYHGAYSGSSSRLVGVSMGYIEASSNELRGIGIFAYNSGGVNVYYFGGDIPGAGAPILSSRGNESGRLLAQYTAATDELSFSAQEFIGGTWTTVTPDTMKFTGLRTTVDLPDVSVFLAGGSFGAPAASGELFLDNFSAQGTVTPEPVSTVLFLVGGGVFGYAGWRKKKRSSKRT